MIDHPNDGPRIYADEPLWCACTIPSPVKTDGVDLIECASCSKPIGLAAVDPDPTPPRGIERPVNLDDVIDEALQAVGNITAGRIVSCMTCGQTFAGSTDAVDYLDHYRGHLRSADERQAKRDGKGWR